MKNFLNKLSIKFQRFMYGRYGIDRLYSGLLYIYLVLFSIGFILGRVIDMRISTAVSTIGLGIIIFSLYRVFSKNIAKRKAENDKWLVFENAINRKFRLIRDRFKFRKTHVFKKCPSCKSVLRLKRVKGKHTVNCPNCKADFEVNVR